MYNAATQMLIYMINTYTDAVYGTTGDYDTIKADIMSATGMDEVFFESIKDELDFVSFAKDEDLAGIAVLQTAQREDRKKQGAYYPHPSLAKQIQAASFCTGTPNPSSKENTRDV